MGLSRRGQIRLSALLFLLVLDMVFFIFNIAGTITAYKND